MKKLICLTSLCILFPSTGVYCWESKFTQDTSIDGTETFIVENGTKTANNWMSLNSVKSWMSGYFEPYLGNPTVSGYVLSKSTDGTVSWIANGSGETMMYPGVGIAVSTGSAWGTSYSLGTLATAMSSYFAAPLGADDNYVTDAEKVKLSNLSGTNTGDQTPASLGLVIGTNVQAYNANLTDLADGSLTGSKVGPGINGDNITTGTVADARISSTLLRTSAVNSLATTSLSCSTGQIAKYNGSSWACSADDSSGTPTASSVPFTPNGSISATNVQAAIQEVRDEAESGGMVYPVAGIPLSTGSAWGTSYTLGTLADALTHTFTGTTYSGSSLVGATQTILNTIDATIDLTAGTGITLSSGQISVTAGTYQPYDAGMISWPSAVTATEIGYVDGVTSAIQTQLNNKAPLVASSVDGSTSTTLTAAQVSGTIVSNYGQSAADVALVLPTAAAGYNALFVVGTAQAYKWGVRAGTSDKIYLLAADGTISAGSDNGYARFTNAQIGQSFACWTFKTGASTWDWQCKAGSIGTSTFAAN